MQDEPDKSPPLDAGAALPVNPAPANLPLPSTPEPEPEADDATDEAAANPAWADDLRKLYNAVVEEPLPDSLIDLLSQLDNED